MIYEKVQNLTIRLCEQLKKKSQDEQKAVESLLYSDTLSFLQNEQRDHIQKEGKELVNQGSQIGEIISNLLTEAKDLQTISDFPAQKEGRFGSLLTKITEERNILKDIAINNRKISQYLQEISLTPDEDRLIKQLPVRDNDIEVDLVDWLKLAGLPPEDFWKFLHSLYDKQHVRIKVSKVRT